MLRKRYSPILQEKRNALIQGAMSPSAFPTQTALAKHLHISRAALDTNLRLLAKQGVLSKANHLLHTTYGGLNPTRAAQLQKRKANMLAFVREAVRRKKKISANMLQQKFGGEKKLALAVIAQESARLGRAKVLRRTKSDQPKRIN